MSSTLLLSDDIFRRVSRTVGDAEAASLLKSIRLNRTLLLMGYVAGQEPELYGAVEDLSTAQRHAPERADDVIGYPWVGVWASRSVRKPLNSRDRQHFRSVATSALIQAGVVGIETVALAQSRCDVVLPRLGVVKDDSWHPVRKLVADYDGYRIAVILDDLDPYRDCHGYPVAARLSQRQWSLWQRSFELAWRLLVQYAPDRCLELSAGLASITPLRAEVKSGMSVTCSDAFGGLAATLPGDPAQLAVTLVHEFQHSKLNALLDVAPLYDPDHKVLYQVPWRTDPRPIAGVLHGIYAFSAVADFWRALTQSPEYARQAGREHALIGEQVARVFDYILDSPALTTRGVSFVAELAQSCT
jgi:hypothetical protein